MSVNGVVKADWRMRMENLDDGIIGGCIAGFVVVIVCLVMVAFGLLIGYLMWGVP